MKQRHLVEGDCYRFRGDEIYGFTCNDCKHKPYCESLNDGENIK
jgi:hypothetical protein